VSNYLNKVKLTQGVPCKHSKMTLRESIEQAPHSPGVYLFYGNSGQVVLCR